MSQKEGLQGSPQSTASPGGGPAQSSSSFSGNPAPTASEPGKDATGFLDASDFRALSDACPVGIYYCNAAGQCLYTNPKWQEIYSLTQDASLGHAWMGRVHPSDLPEVTAALLRGAESGREFETAYRVLAADGTYLHVLAKARPVRLADATFAGYVGTIEDVSEQYRYEEKLRASNAFLDRAEKISGVGGWEFDLHSQSVRWTEQTCRIYELPCGFQPSPDEHLKYFSADAAALIEGAANVCISSGQPWDLELPMVTASGRHIWVRSVGQVEIQEGKPQRLVGALQDVTAKHEMEDQLRKSNAILQSVLNNLPCGLSVFDGQLQLVAHNQHFRSLLALPEQLFAGPVTSFESIIRHNALRGEYGEGDVDQKVLDIVGRARDPQPHHFQRKRPDGTTLEIRGAPMPGGGFVTTYTDITPTEKARVALTESEERLHRALQGSRLALWDWHVDSGEVFRSDAWTEMLGATEPVQVANIDEQASLVLPEDREQVRAAVSDMLTGRRPAYSQEYRIRRPDGGVLWLHSTGQVVQRDASGRALRAVGTQRDVTQRKRVEEELRVARDAADSANRAKTDFLATMSHEVRTPLNGIMGLTQLLLDEALTAGQRAHAELIDVSSQTLLSLINDFLDVSKIEAGQLAIEDVAFDLRALLTGVCNLYRHRAADKSIGFDVELDAGLSRFVRSDPTRLRQILNNLLGNAFKFTSEGSVTLRASVMHTRDPEQLRLRLSVADTGIGIPTQVQQRLFTRFTQADSSTARKYGGTGLGLAIVKQLAELMHGQVWLESAEGKGSTFTVDLPVGASQAMVQEADSPSAAGISGQPRILLAEDNPINQIVAQGMLRKLGCVDVEIAVNGEEAVRKALAGGFDLVFMDCQMPVIDGYEATTRLRDAGYWRPIVAMTANAIQGDRERCIAAGMDDYMSKPVEREALAAILKRWGEGAQAGVPVPLEAPALRELPVFDRHALEERFTGDHDLLEVALRAFMMYTPELLTQLQNAAESDNRSEIFRLAHSAKGSGAMVCAEIFRSHASSLEQQAASASRESLAEMTSALRVSFEDFATKLNGHELLAPVDVEGAMPAQ